MDLFIDDRYRQGYRELLFFQLFLFNMKENIENHHFRQMIQQSHSLIHYHQAIQV